MAVSGVCTAITAWVLSGGVVLSGEASVDGSKNIALPLLAAAAALRQRVELTNVPGCGDVRLMLDLLWSGGYELSAHAEGVLVIEPGSGHVDQVGLASAARIRASYYLVPALLAGGGRAALRWPGGCDVGYRGMELHHEVYRAFGDTVTTSDRGYVVTAAASSGASTVQIRLPFRSRGASIAALLRSVVASRPLRLVQPNLSDDVRCVVDAVARAGHWVRLTANDLEVRPVPRDDADSPCWRVPGDKIEAGTLLVALAITRGSGRIHGAPSAHLASLTAALRSVGFAVECADDTVAMTADGRCVAGSLRALSSLDPGGLDADFEPALLALGLTVPGCHCGEDWINPRRHANLLPQLRRLGAAIEEKSSTRCSLMGPQRLVGATVNATDIRTGSALVLAGLVASGQTVVANADQIARGHANLAAKLQGLGASIETRVAADA